MWIQVGYDVLLITFTGDGDADGGAGGEGRGRGSWCDVVTLKCALMAVGKGIEAED